jgi:nonsense-mediated mRNA decay protein 3
MFCPQCGREGEELYQGLCRLCFIKENHLIRCPDKVEATICAHCNSTFQEGKWKDSNLELDEMISEILTEAIEPLEVAESVDLSFKIINQRGSKWDILVSAQGRVFGEEVNQECQVNFKIYRTVCPDCSKYASGYYEAVIQLRADKRHLDPSETEMADSVIKKLLQKLVEKNRMAYLVDRVEIKEGIDYYIGSYKAARSVVNGLKDTLGGIAGESPRLMGRDKSAGKDLYRIWISLRLPSFKKGDFIRQNQSLGRVVNLDGRGILLEDLESWKQHAIPWKEYNQLVKVSSQEMIKKTTITSITPKEIQILHPDTYEPLDMDLKPYMDDYKIGEEVDVVEIDHQIYILKKKDDNMDKTL